MSKAKVSDKFAQFETRNEHKLAESRKEEKRSFGNPLPVGYNGVGVISDAKADASKKGDPYCSVEVTIVSDDDYRGKPVTGAFRSIKDTAKMTAAENYASLLDDLEDMGLSRQTREGSNIAGCLDELLSTPHYVSVSVSASTYGDGKQIKCYAVGDPGMSGRTAEDAPSTPDSPPEESVSELPQCIYLGKPHYVEGTNSDKTLNLISVKTGKKRPNVPADDVEQVED